MVVATIVFKYSFIVLIYKCIYHFTFLGTFGNVLRSNASLVCIITFLYQEVVPTKGYLNKIRNN